MYFFKTTFTKSIQFTDTEMNPPVLMDDESDVDPPSSGPEPAVKRPGNKYCFIHVTN